MVIHMPKVPFTALSNEEQGKAHLGSAQCSKSEHDLGPLVDVFNVDIRPSHTDSQHFHIPEHV